MQIYNNPNLNSWRQICTRPEVSNNTIPRVVSDILSKVQKEGDKALIEYAKSLDKSDLDSVKVSDEEWANCDDQVPNDLKDAISLAASNIELFHRAQLANENRIETQPGVTCWRKQVPIDKVGLYIPGGTAPLVSTVLMLGIPAKIAECKEIVLCTPPQEDGTINPTILYTAKLLGIRSVFKTGGAQAVGAMAFGSESVPQVYKIFGPGNLYVTEAKQQVQKQGVAIDMPAGPSEVLVIADETSDPAFVASDLLSQAEHGTDSQVVLVANKESIITETLQEVQNQLETLPRKEIAAQAIKNSAAVVFDDIETGIGFSNFYAPEHLIIASENATSFIPKITNAGSVFLGNYSCESAGDYASGTNHTLPTNGYARNYSGVSLDSFMKQITFQELTPEGIQNIGPAIELLATAEGLQAHKNAVSIRLEKLNYGK